MNENEKFEKANQVVHPVEEEWHYQTMVKYGYIADTKTAVGFVRHYKYHHPATDHVVTACTGASADHWYDNKNNYGFWSTLEPCLQINAPIVVNMKTFKDLVFQPAQDYQVAKLTFDNGYGVSVIVGHGARGTKQAPYELIPTLNGELCFDTPVTNDSVNELTPEGVTGIMQQLQVLPVVG